MFFGIFYHPTQLPTLYVMSKCYLTLIVPIFEYRRFQLEFISSVVPTQFLGKERHSFLSDWHYVSIEIEFELSILIFLVVQ